ncbi:hypothetical protein ACIA8O_04665 [Kitasatospora sp. NPDC051853]|uniref:hypothetical protein n=1 Tax=Kitasatospora sp. NPDC051853 TaxID=3364058 RepID=UPI00379DF214
MHIGTRPRARSGYLLQVEAIAATELRERESELAELAAFCTDGAAGPSYWRWLAPAWAGKSALLARLVLEPPEGVDIVSFFITSRLARQNDVAAFCEVVQRQLYAMLNEEEPLSTPCTRDEQLRLAIDRVAQRCAERGRRLVLVVDGLDEDRGVTAGPESHSIAALLPRVPPHGMRIVLAGRPHPPVPEDVAPDHPLRSTEIDHRLEPSPHARAARWFAEQDLMRLLDGGGLGRELIGLTVAAGGGLSASDLAELTGSRTRLIERELSAVGGRSFQRRAATWRADAPEAYLLAHEEIQQSAAELITAEELVGYRTRLYTWARRYRDGGWPDTTPEYLLRGYAQLLQEAGETGQLVYLVSDSARHERLWQTTGSDLHGLYEMSAAMEQLLSDGRRTGDQDVSSALRLAVSRKRLEGRTVIAPELIALWAKLGDTDRAVSLARSQPEAYERVAALAAVAEVLAAEGQPTQALRLLDGGWSAKESSKLLRGIAEGLAEAGRGAEAWRIASSITDVEARAAALTAALKAMAAKEDGPADLCAAEAVAAAERVTNIVTQTELRSSLALSLAALGHTRRAAELIDRAVETASRDHEPFRRPQLLAMVSKDIATDPRLAPKAWELARGAARLTENLEDPEDVAWVLSGVAAALGATGQEGRAVALIDGFFDDGPERAAAVASVGQAVAEAGDVASALRWAERLADSHGLAEVLIAVGLTSARRGESDRCAAVAARIVDAAAKEDGAGRQAKLLVGAADFLHRAGLVEAARSLATAATAVVRDGAPHRRRFRELVEFAHVLGTSGVKELGARVVRVARDSVEGPGGGFGYVLDLVRVAEALHHTGHEVEALELLRVLLDYIEEYVGGSEQAEAMWRVADAFASAGHQGRAGELASEILELAETRSSSSRRAWDTLSAVHAFIAAKDFVRALELLDTLPWELTIESRSEAVKALADAGDLGLAERVARALEGWWEFDRSMGYLAAGSAVAGDFVRALRLLNEMESPVLCDRATPAVVRALARAGVPDEARALTETVTEPENRGQALGSIAASFGAGPRGRVVLVEALSLGQWDQLVSDVAVVTPDCLPLLVELVLQED